MKVIERVSHSHFVGLFTKRNSSLFLHTSQPLKHISNHLLLYVVVQCSVTSLHFFYSYSLHSLLKSLFRNRRGKQWRKRNTIFSCNIVVFSFSSSPFLLLTLKLLIMAMPFQRASFILKRNVQGDYLTINASLGAIILLSLMVLNKGLAKINISNGFSLFCYLNLSLFFFAMCMFLCRWIWQEGIMMQVIM